MAADPREDILDALEAVIRERSGGDPEQSYVAALLADGPPRIGRKLGEEAVESVIAGMAEDPDALVNEIADLWFHSLVLLAARDRSLEDVREELARRFGLSGIEEKRRREN